ncbi:MAG: replicative DNA helicase [Clostridia bacterium]|nr:replicative DNA helicase [Clostridia bacterium]
MAETNNTPTKTIKVYPNSYEAEQYLLCCILLDGIAAGDLLPSLKSEIFYNERHRKIFEACQKLFSANRAVDVITVNDQIEADKKTDLNMLDYHVELSDKLPSAANYREYVDILKRDHMHREIIRICNETIEMAYANKDYRETLTAIEEKIYKLNSSTHRSELIHISEASGQVVARVDALCRDKNSFRGIMTKFARFDQITNGLQKGALVILAARPSVGKTSFALNIVSNIASQPDSKSVIAVFSLEMPSVQLAQRLLSDIGSIPMNSLSKGTTQDREQESLIAAHSKISESKVYVDDTALSSPGDIFSKCRRLYATEKRIDLIVIDYLQLMKGDSVRSSDSKQNEISDISRMMKILAKEMNCPVLVLSQMSRGIENRDDKTPKLSDLRESGAIEQDADIVLFLSRENENDKVSSNYTVFLDIAKHRNGELGVLRFNWEGQYVRFTESTDQYINRDLPVKKTKGING